MVLHFSFNVLTKKYYIMKLRQISESVLNVVITAIDEEDDWELAEQAEQVAKNSNIHISRDKKLLLVAMADDTVVGATWASFYESPDYEGAHCFDFDIAVDPAARATGVGMVSSNIGPKLIDATLREYRDLAAMYDYEKTYIRVQVVNQKLARFLEHRYGFESSGGWSPTNPHMEFYG